MGSRAVAGGVRLVLRVAMVFVLGSASLQGAGIEFKGTHGPGKGKHVVLVAADDEYHSEEALPQLAKILAMGHGFTCTVLFAIDPHDGTIDLMNATTSPVWRLYRAPTS